ncbi:MAG: PQQ-binding-like beta-propeller repeat protein, partial [bacterium]
DYLFGVPPGPAEAAGWLAILPKLDSAQASDIIARLENRPGLPADTQARVAAARKQLAVPAMVSASLPLRPGLPQNLWSRETESGEKAWLLSDINDLPSAKANDQKSAILRTGSDGRVSIISRSDGSVIASLGDEMRKPLWAGLVKGRGLVFDGRTIVGFDPVTGRRAWRLDLAQLTPGSAFSSPFAKASGRAEEGQGESEARRSGELDWWMFQASGDRLIVQSVQGDCWRIDPVFGRLYWHRRTEPGDGATAILLGRHVLMRDGSSVLLLDADSGEMKRSIDGSIAGTQWIRRPMAWDEDRVLMTADRMQVIMLDLKTGQQVWRWQASEIQPTNGPPRYFRHGDGLVAVADGKTLVRLDPKNGNRLWTTPLGAFDYSLEFRNVSMDDRHVYLSESMETAAGGGVSVKAYSLADGSPLWSRRIIGSAISWALESVGSGEASRLWVYPDCETSRRLVSGQAMTAQPADLGENQGNASPGISSVVVELDPAEGRIHRRIVSRVSDSANWVMPDWSGGQLLWASRSGSRQNLIQIEPAQGQPAAHLTPR